jgi:hypothetical protein
VSGVRRSAWTGTVLLVVAALVLGGVVLHQVLSEPGTRTEAGELTTLRTQPYGRDAAVIVPGSQVDLRVGRPVSSLAFALLDDGPGYGSAGYDQPLLAPEGGVLVPVSFRVRGTGGFGADEDPRPVEVALVAGEEEVELDGSDPDVLDWTSLAVAVAGDHDVDDLSVEVTYEGLTQRVDVATGEIDAGGATSLYEPRPVQSTGCEDVEDHCDLHAVPESPVRPDGAGFIAGPVSFSPYSAGLGWAEEGQRWAFVRYQLFGTFNVQNARGRFWFPRDEEAPVFTLDGEKPVRVDDDTDHDLGFYGVLTFAVDAEEAPRELVVEQEVLLPPRADVERLPLSTRVELTTP